MLQDFRNLVSTLFRKHKYLTEELDEEDLNQFQSILNCKPQYTKTSLKFLSQLLTKYHKSPCIVLIDEYDAPMECAFNNNSDNPYHKGFEFLKEAKTFFGSLFSGLLKVKKFSFFKKC